MNKKKIKSSSPADNWVVKPISELDLDTEIEATMRKLRELLMRKKTSYEQ